MQEHIHIQEIITSLIYNVNPHQSNAALSFPASHILVVNVCLSE